MCAKRNRALAYFMVYIYPISFFSYWYLVLTHLLVWYPSQREQKALPSDINIEELLDFYFQTCSMEMNVKGMASIAATLANGGISPSTGRYLYLYMKGNILNLQPSSYNRTISPYLRTQPKYSFIYISISIYSTYFQEDTELRDSKKLFDTDV